MENRNHCALRTKMRSNPGKANEANHLTMRSIFHPYKGERYCAHPRLGIGARD